MIDRVSVVMTVANEPAIRLVRSLSAIAAQRTNRDVEVVVAAVPGDRELARALAGVNLTEVRVVPNPSGRRSEGLNRAIAATTGSVVCRVDARSRVPSWYVDRCIDRLETDARVGVVGGRQRACAEERGTVPAGVARGLRNPYLLGAPAYRRAGAAGPVDTVYLGSWRRSDLDSVGGFDERLEANEDFDLCRRFADAGWIVWLEAGLEVPYEPRSRLIDVFGQYHAFGRSKVSYWRATGNRPNKRQFLALFLFGVVVGALPFLMGRPRRMVLAFLAGEAGLLTLDHLAEPSGPPLERLAATGTAACTGLGWLSGVTGEVIGRKNK